MLSLLSRFLVVLDTHIYHRLVSFVCFFFNDTATTEIYTLSLHDALPIQPEAAARHYRDLYGNPCLRVTLPAGQSSLRYDALAEVPDAVEDADEDAAEV